MHKTGHTFSQDNDFVSKNKIIREYVSNLKVKSDAGLRTQYQEFIEAYKDELEDYIPKGQKKSKKTIVRPYLEDLYLRLGKKLANPQDFKGAGKEKDKKRSTSPTKPSKTEKSPSPPKQAAPTPPDPAPSLPVGLPAGLPMPGSRSRNRSNSPQKKPANELPKEIPSLSAFKKPSKVLKSALLDPKNKGRNKKVGFDPLRNDTRIISPKKKIIFDWEFQKPNDDSIDPEHEEFLEKMRTGKIKGSKELKRKNSDEPEEAKEEKEEKPEKKNDDDQEEAPVLDLHKYKPLKKAIFDNRCIKEEWITYRKEFLDLKGSLSEGITVKKYGRKNFFNADERRLFFIDNFTHFTWSKLTDTKYDKVFSVADIQVLKLGKKTDNLKRFKKAVENLCFSIVMKDRTIDLEFRNQKDLRFAYFGIKFFHKIINRFRRNLYLFESLNDDFPLEIFDEVESDAVKKGIKWERPD